MCIDQCLFTVIYNVLLCNHGKQGHCNHGNNCVIGKDSVFQITLTASDSSSELKKTEHLLYSDLTQATQNAHKCNIYVHLGQLYSNYNVSYNV